MATLNGAQAGDRLLSFGTVTPGTCLNAVWRAFGSPKSDGRYPYATATEALRRARELGAIKGYDINTAPEGAVLFWSNVWGNWKAGWSDAGHIAIKGPNNTVTTIDLPVRGRVGRVKPSAIWKHIKFEGWALGDGAFLGHAVTSPANLTLSKPKAAAESAAPIPPKRKRKTMFIHWTTDGRGWLVTPEGWVHITDAKHVPILRRMLNPEKEDKFTPAEVDMMNVYLAKASTGAVDKIRADLNWINQTSPDSLKALHDAILAKPAAAVDSKAIAEAVTAAVVAQIAKQGVTVDSKAVAAAVDAALLDNFAGIPKAVNDETASRLKS